MKPLLFIAVVIVAPLFYLWEHAYSFRLCQQVARLEEQKLRQREVNDSLQSRLASLSSRHGIEARAMALGLEPRVKPSPLIVPAGLVPSPRTATPVLAAAKAKAPKSKVAASLTRRSSPAAAKPVATIQHSAQSVSEEDIVVKPVKPQNGGL